MDEYGRGSGVRVIDCRRGGSDEPLHVPTAGDEAEVYLYCRLQFSPNEQRANVVLVGRPECVDEPLPHVFGEPTD